MPSAAPRRLLLALELGEEMLVLLVPQPKLMESKNGEMGLARQL
jgi:hypothetical protein